MLENSTDYDYNLSTAKVFENIRLLFNVKSNKDLANIFSVSENSISQYKKNDKLPIKWIVNLCLKHDIPIKLIFSDLDKEIALSDVKIHNIPFLSLINEKIIYNRLSLNETTLKKYIDMDTYKSGNFYYSQSIDNSMYPNLKKEEFFTLKLNESKIANNEMYVIKLMGSLLICRIQIFEKHYKICFDNQYVDDFTIENNINVYGRVLQIFPKLKNNYDFTLA